MGKNIDRLAEDGIKFLNYETETYYKNIRLALNRAKRNGFGLGDVQINHAMEEYKKYEEKRIDRGLEESDYKIPPREIKKLLDKYLETKTEIKN